MVGAIVLSPTDVASQRAVVSSAQLVAVARARAPRCADVQHCLEHLDSYHPDFELILSSTGALGRSYTSRVYFRKLHHALRMHRSTSMDKSAL